MKYNEVTSFPMTELKKKKTEMTKDYYQLKMKHSLGQITNPIQIRDLRKDIARVKTAIQVAFKS